MTTVPIRNAATVILLRETNNEPHVLMGQRGKAAVFMPNKFVFPGGGVDVADGASHLRNLIGGVTIALKASFKACPFAVRTN